MKNVGVLIHHITMYIYKVLCEQSILTSNKIHVKIHFNKKTKINKV